MDHYSKQLTVNKQGKRKDKKKKIKAENYQLKVKLGKPIN